MKQALVLGATGFIGGQIARAAVAHGWQVRAARRRETSTGAIGDLAVDWQRADLDDADSLLAAMRGADVVFHSAGRYLHTAHNIPRHVAQACAEIERVLRAARQAGVSRLIYTSTLTTIGPPLEPGQPADERSTYRPGSASDAYHELKWAMEQVALSDGGPVVALCPTLVLGPGDVNLSAGKLLLAIAQGRVPFSLNGQLNVIDARDAAEAHIAAAERGRLGERYILGGHALTIEDLVVRTAQLAGVPVPRWRLPDGVAGFIGWLSRWLPGDPAALVRSRHLLSPLSNAKAVAELGLAPRPLAETLGDALAWLRACGYLESRVV